MNFTSIADIYFISTGLLSYNILYNVLFDTGLVYLPFIMVILSEMSDSIASGRTASLQRKMEVRFLLMFVCISLTFIPTIDYKISGMKTFTRMCELDGTKKYFDEEPQGYQNSEVRNVLASVSGYDLKFPALLGFVYNLATGVTLESVDRLPCAVNITAFNAELMDSIIIDTELLLQTRAFLKTCYYPAKVLAIRNKDLGMPWIADPDDGEIAWAGNPAFFHPSYYGNTSKGFYSKVLLEGYEKSPNNKNISSWQNNPDVQSLGGFPTCREWWNGVGDGFSGYFSGGAKGLRKELLDNLRKAYSEGKVEQFFNVAAIYGGGDIRENEDAIIRAAYFNEYNISSIVNAERVTDYSERSDGFVSTANEHLARFAGTVGTVQGAFASYAGASIIQLAAPIFKAITLMMILAVAPIASVASSYSFKFVVPFYFFLFSVVFWSFLWELTLLTQQSFVDEVLGEGADLDIITHPNIALVGTSLTDAQFILFPSILTGMLSLAGINVTSMASAADKPGSSEGSDAKNGGKKVQGKASKGGKEIASKMKKKPPKK
ncbi:conjugal transfer protein TraG N-terminal domain-containing protein [Pseudoalteromonas luteoviolacea]|uniref:TraG N-terminal Proteobacteria domain-containing protein n=1 Tax=Pseudoalteromonas luteoviolacea S4060-1 TaxID=1365257 RepID=A0A167KWG3_9GAMM|nr:conjugal transfer protein TraG N-terminal domain-containing protein [Pseudoalteromonas luteoviolacea]KZN63400.1 hypothetical protein N478_03865 [Pseudoalteromonas luteoviolacea S4060-1]